MTEPVEDSEFLKCDAPDCDHFEKTPITIAVVDKPCPKCGANLCTKEDFIVFKTYAAASRAATELVLRENPNAPLVLAAHNFHAGEIFIKHDGVVHGKNPFPNKGVEP